LIGETLLEDSRTHFAMWRGCHSHKNLLVASNSTMTLLLLETSFPMVDQHTTSTPSRSPPLPSSQTSGANYPTLYQCPDPQLLPASQQNQKWPEHTTISPTVHHQGIYKTLQKHMIRKKKNTTNEPEDPASISDALLKDGMPTIYFLI